MPLHFGLQGWSSQKVTYNFADGTSYTCPSARCSKADRDGEPASGVMHACAANWCTSSLAPLHAPAVWLTLHPMLRPLLAVPSLCRPVPEP